MLYLVKGKNLDGFDVFTKSFFSKRRAYQFARALNYVGVVVVHRSSGQRNWISFFDNDIWYHSRVPVKTDKLVPMISNNGERILFYLYQVHFQIEPPIEIVECNNRFVYIPDSYSIEYRAYAYKFVERVNG